MKPLTFPAWFNGPNGQTAIFGAAEDVPTGWTSGSEGQSVDGKVKQPAPPKAPPQGKKGKKGKRGKKAGGTPPAPTAGAPLDL